MLKVAVHLFDRRQNLTCLHGGLCVSVKGLETLLMLTGAINKDELFDLIDLIWVSCLSLTDER